MSESPSLEDGIFDREIAHFCTEIFQLYPNTRGIQERYDENTKRFSCAMQIAEPITQNEKDKIGGDVLDIIVTKIFPLLPSGAKCAIQDITFLVKNSEGEIPTFSPETDMRAICTKVEEVFSRDAIRVRFENGSFRVYGSAPRDHAAINGEINKHFPETVTNTIEFKPGIEWEIHKEPYRKIMDMFPNDVEGVRVLKRGKILSIKIMSYESLSEEQRSNIQTFTTSLVISDILPTMPGFSPLISFAVVTENEDAGVEAAISRANDAFAGVDVPSRLGLFSNLGLLLGCLSDWFESERSPK